MFEDVYVSACVFGYTCVCAPVAVAASEKEPGWALAFAIVGFLVTIWATMVHYSISQDASPKDSFFTSAWAK